MSLKSRRLTDSPLTNSSISFQRGHFPQRRHSSLYLSSSTTNSQNTGDVIVESALMSGWWPKGVSTLSNANRRVNRRRVFSLVKSIDRSWVLAASGKIASYFTVPSEIRERGRTVDEYCYGETLEGTRTHVQRALSTGGSTGFIDFH